MLLLIAGQLPLAATCAVEVRSALLLLLLGGVFGQLGEDFDFVDVRAHRLVRLLQQRSAAAGLGCR